MGKRVKRDINVKDKSSISIRFEGQDEFIAFNVDENDGISEIGDVSLNKDDKLFDKKSDNNDIKDEHSSFAEQFINAVKEKNGTKEENKDDEIAENNKKNGNIEIDDSVFVYSSNNKGKRSVLTLFLTLIIIIPVGFFGFYLGQEYAKKHDEQLQSVKEEYMYDILNTGYTDEDVQNLKNKDIRAFLQSIGVIMYDIPEIEVSKYNVFSYNDEEFMLNISNNKLEINNDNGTLFRFEYKSNDTIVPVMYDYNDYLVILVKIDDKYVLQILNQQFEMLLNVNIIEEGILTFSSTDIYYGTVFCPNKMFDVEPQISIYRYDINKNINEAFGVLKEIPDGACNY